MPPPQGGTPLPPRRALPAGGSPKGAVHMSDTIAAIATGQSVSAIGIVRVSGDEAVAVAVSRIAA